MGGQVRAAGAVAGDIEARAAEVLDALLEDRPPPPIPSESPQWTEAFLGAFRRFRAGQRGREARTAAERLGRTGAANPLRFFWEFWQNADDAGATELRFEVQNDALTIRNDGRPFTTFEVFSLLTVGGSTKYGDDHTMGQWGVGSLALMRFSDRPTYESGPWAFALEQSFTYPSDGGSSTPDGVPGLRVVAPLRSGVDPVTLATGLASLLNDEALLYMRHLERVTVTGPAGEVWTVQSRVQRSGAASRVELGEEVWLRYEEELAPPEGMTRDDGRKAPPKVHLAIARRARTVSSPSYVYVFFPTQVRHDYPWRFSAPLDVTTGREGILNGDYNRWLLREVGRAMVRGAGHHMAGSRSAPWSLVPGKPEADPLLSEVWNGALEEMSSTAWLPAGRKRVRADEAAFAESTTVRELLRAADISALSEGARVWLTGVPGADVHDALSAAGVMRVGPHEVARVLSTAQRSRGPEWFLRATCASLEEPLLPRTHELLVSGRCFLSARGTPFSLGEAHEKGKVVCNARSEILSTELGDLFSRNLVVLLHRFYRLSEKKSDSELDGLRRRLDEWLRDESSDETFAYESRFDASTFIKLFIVERGAAASGGEVADRLLSFARDHLESYVSDQGKANRQRTYTQLGAALRIRAFQWDSSGRRVTDYRRVSEVHLATGYVDRSSWSEAARGVPGIWWADSRYRRSLVRRDSPLSVNAFLKSLGAADGPRLVPIAKNGWHNNYRFVQVTHGDTVRFPHFPHKATKFGEYSAYGLRDDWDSPELTAVLDHIDALPARERGRRGEALLRTLEEQWDTQLKDRVTTMATGYWANGEYEILRGVAPRWLWSLRGRGWVDRGKLGRGSPSETYARMPATVSLLNPAIDPLCTWETRNSEVAVALGFKTQVPAAVVLRYLREARRKDALLGHATARAYYTHLAALGGAAPETVPTITAEGLVYCDRSRIRWRTPDECLQASHRDTFGPYVGYLEDLPQAGSLWDALSIRRQPDFEFIVNMWERLSRSMDSGDVEMRGVLPGTYAVAETLAPDTPLTNPVPVVSEDGWSDSTSVFVTGSSELAAQLSERGLIRWDNPFFELHPRLTKALRILDADRDASIQVVGGERTAADDERRIHDGVTSFAAEVHAAQPDLWRLLERRLRQIVEGRVERLRPLRLRVEVKHPRLGTAAFEIQEPAFYRDGSLYLSELTTASDRPVAVALLSGLRLAGQERWAALNGLQLHMTHRVDGGTAFPAPVTLDERSAPEEDLFAPSEPEEAKAPMLSESEVGRRERKPEPPPHPVDSYVVSSDTAPDPDLDEPTGGLVARAKAKLRKPSREPSGGGSGGHRGPDRHSRNATEQRGVELYRTYVLERDGIEVRDQRIRDRVGADLVGNDGIFRELKTFTGDAPGSLPLTEHEYRRAGNRGDAYELVVVERVWDEPVITVVADPLTRLRYAPAGGVVVTGWRELKVGPRVVRLSPDAPDDKPSR